MAAVVAVRQEFSGTSFGTGPFTTGAFTPPDNSLLVVFAELLLNSAGNPASPTITDSLGTPLTYTNRAVSHQDNIFSHSVTCFTAPVTTGASMTITLDDAANTVYQYVFTAVAVTGYNTGAPIGGNAVVAADVADGAETLTLSAAPGTDDITFAITCIDDSGSAATPTMGAGSWISVYNGVSNLGTALNYRTASTSTSVPWTDVYTGGGAFDKGILLAIVIGGVATAAVAEATEPTVIRTWIPELAVAYSQPDGTDAVAVASADQNTTGILFADGNAYADVTHDATSSGYLPAGVAPYGTVTHDATSSGYLPAAVVPRATASHDATIAGYLPAAVDPRAAVTHDATITAYLPAGVASWAITQLQQPTTGVLYAAVAPYATVSHNANAAGYLVAGVDLRATFSHDVPVVGYLPAGVVTYALLPTADYNTVGILYLGADLRATVSHAANVAGYLVAGAVPLAPVTHNATVVGYVTVGAAGYAIVSGASDYNTTGVLYTAVDLRAPVTHNVTGTGLLAAGVDLRATVTRTTSVAGYLAVAPSLLADVTRVVSLVGYLPTGVGLWAVVSAIGPTVADANPTLIVWREPDALALNEESLLRHHEHSLLEWREESLLTGRDAWLTYKERP